MPDSIVINVIPDPSTNITINDTGENVYLNPLTLNQGIINHSVTHQSGGSDELLHNLLAGLNGGQSGQYYHLNSGQYFNLTTGDVVRPSDTGNFITINQTGAFYPNSNPSGFITGVDLSGYVTGDVVRPSQTGNFITINQTGSFYSSSNPSGFITGVDLSNYTTIGDVTGISGSLQGQINEISSITGDFYPANNPSGFITGVDLSIYSTIDFATGISGNLQEQITNLSNNTGEYVTGDVVRPDQTGEFYPKNNPSGFITGVDLSSYATINFTTGISGSLQTQINDLENISGDFVLQSETGVFYAASNPSGFITGIDNIVYTTGDQTISGTKQFINRPTVNGTGVMLSGEAAQLPSGIVFTSGSQSITGLKTFDNLEFNTGAAVSASIGQFAWNATDSTLDLGLNSNVTLQLGQEIHYPPVKALQDIRNGMAVFAAGAVGGSENIEVRPFRAKNGDADELYFIGVATENITANNYGFVSTFGKVRGVNGNSYTAGGVKDSSDTGAWNFGAVLYASPNISGCLTQIQPTAPDKRLPIAMVLKAPNQGNITLMVRADHGYHLSEIHDVYSNGKLDRQVLMWNSGSGYWSNDTITTGDVSGLSNYATQSYVTETSGFLQTQINTLNNHTGDYVLDSETGQFYPANNPSGFITGISNIVFTTGNQTITGVKDFISLPTISGNAIATVSDPVRTTVTGNGILTSFNISGASGLVNPSALIVAIDGTLQEPVVDYTVLSGSITFTSPLPNGSKAVVISPTNSLQVSQMIPADGSVTSAKLDANLQIAGQLTAPNQLASGDSSVMTKNLTFGVDAIIQQSFRTIPPTIAFASGTNSTRTLVAPNRVSVATSAVAGANGYGLVSFSRFGGSAIYPKNVYMTFCIYGNITEDGAYVTIGRGFNSTTSPHYTGTVANEGRWAVQIRKKGGSSILEGRMVSMSTAGVYAETSWADCGNSNNYERPLMVVLKIENLGVVTAWAIPTSNVNNTPVWIDSTSAISLGSSGAITSNYPFGDSAFTCLFQSISGVAQSVNMVAQDCFYY